MLSTLCAGGESSGGRQARNGVAVCSQRRALLVAGIVLGSLLLTALIIAYAGPQNGKADRFKHIAIVMILQISTSSTSAREQYFLTFINNSI